MTERTESFEIHPMKGHSRGEWYGTLDDIGKSAKKAEYWAVFGVTHRGNKHCLGEFPTESAAQAAVRGLKYFRRSRDRSLGTTPDRGKKTDSTPSSGHGRQIVQLEIVRSKNDDAMMELFALCNDGTVWHRGIGIRGNRGFMDEYWTEITLDGIRE